MAEEQGKGQPLTPWPKSERDQEKGPGSQDPVWGHAPQGTKDQPLDLITWSLHELPREPSSYKHLGFERKGENVWFQVLNWGSQTKVDLKGVEKNSVLA